MSMVYTYVPALPGNEFQQLSGHVCMPRFSPVYRETRYDIAATWILSRHAIRGLRCRLGLVSVQSSIGVTDKKCLPLVMFSASREFDYAAAIRPTSIFVLRDRDCAKS